MTKDKDALVELAARVEAAAGPSHELDLAIAEACYHGGFGGVNYDPALWVERYGGHSGSLDAAMTLVPEGGLWEMGHGINTGRRLSGTFERPEGEPEKDFRAGVGMGEVPARWTHGRSFATPALALTAACLRAQAGKE